MNDFKLLRLTTKEVIICKAYANEKDKNKVVLHDPFEIKSFMNPSTGDFNSTLIDWLQYSSDSFVEIEAFNVLTISTPASDIINHYEMILKRREAMLEDGADEINQTGAPAATDIEEDEEYSIEDMMKMLGNNKVYH